MFAIVLDVLGNFGAVITGAAIVLLFGFATQLLANEHMPSVPWLLGAWGVGFVVACAAFGWRWIYAKLTMDQVELLLQGGLQTPGALVAAACGGVLGAAAHVFMIRKA